jgi:hypothetical protein
MKCPGSNQPTGPLAASKTVRCPWCERDIERVQPLPREPERLPVHNLPEAPFA